MVAESIKNTPLPAEWLDRLLVAYCSVPPTTPLAAAAETVLSVARAILDDVALGVCIPGTDGAQIVVRASARSSLMGSPDPARLFPEFEHERAIAIPSPAADGATLHVAWDDEGRFARGPATAFLERVAQVFGSMIGHRRASERTHSDAVGKLQAQVIQSDKLASLGQIAAGIVHELNNPLTSIVAYSDYLKKKAVKTGGDPADIERLARINEAAERILRFSRDLIEYSRPSREVPAPVAIHDVIDRALVFCEHELDKAGVSVEREFGEVLLVRGVAGQLTQVFVNLFTNAAHAIRGVGSLLRITTAMENDDEEVRVTITDDGHGIDPTSLPHIFDPFFTTKTDGTGTGLGLSIVRNIVVSHGGNIRANGNSPKGTVFHLDLPIAAAPASVRHPPIVEPPPSSH